MIHHTYAYILAAATYKCTAPEYPQTKGWPHESDLHIILQSKLKSHQLQLSRSTSQMHPQSLPVSFSFSTSMQSRTPTSSVSEEPYPILYRIQHPLSNEPIPSALHAGGLYCNQEFRHLRHSEEEGREWSRPWWGGRELDRIQANVPKLTNRPFSYHHHHHELEGLSFILADEKSHFCNAHKSLRVCPAKRWTWVIQEIGLVVRVHKRFEELRIGCCHLLRKFVMKTTH
jgi:hypothetical protein